ncbi:glutamine-hydrolyzing carbamoyl-phosphate synthase small subunit [Methanosalsum natronophilum]|uniref:Carbamoyl phosphate synthase small chain n=1 Tax=Methanosalsum natronophilum TaxID=768733 RepID=A0A424Z0T7_9EURY|nr:glutamine-hydrolyzing carbamoyl-phosphate synthase small subunit [Methanosalsum natronophilum]MCS3924612.1 carbamoyl-phosphate synthase small subunit [Methanosalsum natronophilum]RQD87754.1 MAG: carbamoyl-phosphate synthase small subunit [Methanosalsum natronophilum]
MDAILGLEDGTYVKGTGFGAEGTACGELVFTTQYTGYEEALTDPSYKGQILMFTYPLIGNYGISGDHFQSDGIRSEGFVVRELCDFPSHYKSQLNLRKLAEDDGIPGITGIDTRMLTIKTREHGALRSALIVGGDDVEEAVEKAKKLPPISELDLLSKVTCKEPYELKSKKKTSSKKHAVVIDLGLKNNILISLLKRGVDITVVPSNSKPSTIEGLDPDFLFLTNGPGDPRNATDAIDCVNELAGTFPIMGICFGNQIIARAMGADTYKLKFGHRGANQPVRDLTTGKIYITSQNHGFAVDRDSLDGTEIEVTQENVNDKTVEGISHDYLQIYSVQYHPEAHSGPMDTEEIFFDKVIKTVGGAF